MIQVQSPAARSIIASIEGLDPACEGTRAEIADLRRQMDAACDRDELTLAEWRTLVDLINDVRGQCRGAFDVRGNNGLATH